MGRVPRQTEHGDLRRAGRGGFDTRLHSGESWNGLRPEQPEPRTGTRDDRRLVGWTSAIPGFPGHAEVVDAVAAAGTPGVCDPAVSDHPPVSTKAGRPASVVDVNRACYQELTSDRTMARQ